MRKHLKQVVHSRMRTRFLILEMHAEQRRRARLKAAHFRPVAAGLVLLLGACVRACARDLSAGNQAADWAEPEFRQPRDLLVLSSAWQSQVFLPCKIEHLHEQQTVSMRVRTAGWPGSPRTTISSIDSAQGLCHRLPDRIQSSPSLALGLHGGVTHTHTHSLT